MLALNLIMRWLHIFSIAIAVGVTIFMRVVLVPSLSDFNDLTRTQFLKTLAPRLRTLIHAAIGGILLSGLYNTHVLWKTSVSPYGLVYAMKVLLALIVIIIAIFLTSSNPKRAAFQANRRKWLGLNAVLAMIIILLSAYLRTLHQ
jgi:uncharacterized membrane protein